jgi:Ca2+-binding EF-hand superfamily protein
VKYYNILAAAGGLIIGSALLTAAVAQDRHQGPMGAGMSFAELDHNGDGLLDAEDLDQHRDARFADIDTNGDGEVSEQEFVAEAVRRATERAAAMFARLDADGDGSLSRDVLQMREGGRGDHMLSRALERFDANGDGGLSEDEFAELQEQMGKRMGHARGRRHN